MKRSNIFLLTGVFVLVLLYALTRIMAGQYVTKAAYEQNKANWAAFDKNLYDYKPVAFDQPFDEVLIIGSKERVSRDIEQIICWVPAEQYGLKAYAFANYGHDFKIKNRTLILHHGDVFFYSQRKLYIYAPHIKKITVQNASLAFQQIKVDSMAFDFQQCGKIDLNETNQFGKLSIYADSSSCFLRQYQKELQMEAKLSRYSTLDVQTDFCSRLTVDGDASSKISIAPPLDEKENTRRMASIATLTFNDDMKEVRLKDTKVAQLFGNKQKLVLDMPYKDAKQTIASLSERP